MISASRALAMAGRLREHHPISSCFPGYSGESDGTFHIDYIGAKMRPEFVDQPGPPATGAIRRNIPSVSDEYFEWIDILQSVRDARRQYAMLELGAGYGRWGVRGALAARQAGIGRIRIGLAEAEPAHVEWLKLYLSDNGIGPSESTVYDCTVSDRDGLADFLVGAPDSLPPRTPRTWYGQSICKAGVADSDVAAGELHYGRPVTRLSSGWKVVMVELRGIYQILDDFEAIDLIDLDVLGEELKILTGAGERLDRKVKRLHIGTHSHEIEEGLRQLLRNRGWLLIRDYAYQTTQPTPLGDVAFGDGVQSWCNMRFDVTPT